VKRINQACKLLFLLIGLAFCIAFCLIDFTNAAPTGADVTFVVTDNGPTIIPDNRSDLGATITTITIDAQQRDYSWKGYVGNVTGKFVLRNTNGLSIYEWPSGSSVSGEIYISRNVSVNWSFGAISCADNTELIAEQTFFGMGSVPDNINNTFNATNHSAFMVGSNSIGDSVCRSIATWVNNTAQTPSNTSVFQEIALHDGVNVVYASIINNDKTGFDNTTTYDFQAIVAENDTATVGTTYFFYVELGS
jgi:hypothetical protein